MRLPNGNIPLSNLINLAGKRAIATRCLSLLKRASIEKEFSITGGIAKNKGMAAKLREKVGLVATAE